MAGRFNEQSIATQSFDFLIDAYLAYLLLAFDEVELTDVVRFTFQLSFAPNIFSIEVILV